ncbi:Tetraspanin, partial [Operophtera brumata]
PRLNPSFSCCPDDGTDRAAEIKRSDCLSLEKYYKEGCETRVLGTIHSAGLTVIYNSPLATIITNKQNQCNYNDEKI